MPDLITKPISESEQMYLITIARSIEAGEPEPLPLTLLAQKLSLQPVSVNQMVRKLEAEELVIYHPYKGVELTDQGREIANRILRNRRLWQIFLVDQLNVSLFDADTVACDLEHVTPDEIAFRLSKFLNEPAFSPGGQPIPGFENEPFIPNLLTLQQLEVGMCAQIINIDAPSSVIRFLESEGLHPGSEIRLVAVGAQDARLLSVNEGFIEIAPGIAENIQLVPMSK